MIEVFLVVFPVFLVVGAGYAAVSFNLFKNDYADALMKFTQNFAIPCLLFNAIAGLDLSAVFKPALLGSFYTGSAVCFILSTLGARYLFQRRSGEAVAIGFCALFANSVLLGFPIVERAFGTDALGPITAIVSIHAPFCYLLGITAMEFARADGRALPDTIKVVTKAMFSNALMIGLLLGFFVNLTGLWLPQGIRDATEMMARAALPAALFGLGAVLVRYGIAPNIGETAMILFLRLVIHPSIALILASRVFNLSTEVTQVVVLTAAMSPGINTYVFANMYDRGKATAASGVLLGTGAAVVSVTIWLVILRAL
ncbi:AEC family transporter [Amylibacter sp. IMCC11727]|uniref:AEC family transporter n=1 Tax=Amylibacter sp. IMCC11727 TaxID=3039851 RepID=UPI00244E0757|nr:AEC family transporter [Amylibacter sp. IMCC11727]WGI20527.1 AEC family transporter [Amylibacter sp. IMCC11727]